MFVAVQPDAVLDQDTAGLVTHLISRDGVRLVYVNTPGGVQVGWVDLDSDLRWLAIPELADAFDAAIAAFLQPPAPIEEPLRVADPSPLPAAPRRAIIEPADYQPVDGAQPQRYLGLPALSYGTSEG